MSDSLDPTFRQARLEAAEAEVSRLQGIVEAAAELLPTWIDGAYRVGYADLRAVVGDPKQRQCQEEDRVVDCCVYVADNPVARHSFEQSQEPQRGRGR